jgi:predicted methyltransferase
MVDTLQVRCFVRRIAACVAAVCRAQTLITAQGRADQEKQREQWQRVGDIFPAMGVRPGARVADVGAGDGFFTSRLASASDRRGTSMLSTWPTLLSIAFDVVSKRTRSVT